jgi:threonylcarbamoyladenosine tRNA methylthiotransferase MtaB
MLRTLSEKKRAAFAAKHKGSIRPVLFEGTDRDGMLYGYSDNYIRVAVPFHPSLPNSIVDVHIGEFQGDHCVVTVQQELTPVISLPVIHV